MTESLQKVFANAATGLSAQSIRMNTIASNLANAGNVGTTEQETYHKKFPIFTEITKQVAGINAADQPTGGVKVSSVEKSKKPLEKRYDPDNPSADKSGFVYLTDVNPIEEMTNMIAASKEYEANVEVMNTTKNLIIQSINVLNSR